MHCVGPCHEEDALQLWSLPRSVVKYFRGTHFVLMYIWLIPIFWNFYKACTPTAMSHSSGDQNGRMMSNIFSGVMCVRDSRLHDRTTVNSARGV